jgi:peroxiredoxin
MAIIYAYSLTTKPGTPGPDGWDVIPGADGCTPQSCSFSDHFVEFDELGGDHIFGLSAQDTLYQQEAVDRLHLPFALLSDESSRLATALRLPTFEVSGMTLLSRLTMVVCKGRILKVFYPVFPPDRRASEVANWQRTDQGIGPMVRLRLCSEAHAAHNLLMSSSLLRKRRRIKSMNVLTFEETVMVGGYRALTSSGMGERSGRIV